MPFHTPTALPLPLAESSIRSFYQHLEMRSLLQNGQEIDGADDPRVGVDAVPLMAAYGVAPRTILIAGIPYLQKTFRRAGIEQSNSGFGDLLLMVKQEILARDFVAGNRRLALFAGAMVPTGQTDDDGTALPQALRLGLGTVNLMGRSGLRPGSRTRYAWPPCPLPNWALEASFQLPIVRALRGTQLGPDWSLSVGARTVLYLFDR